MLAVGWSFLSGRAGCEIPLASSVVGTLCSFVGETVEPALDKGNGAVDAGETLCGRRPPSAPTQPPKRCLTAWHGALSHRSARGAVSPLGTGRWHNGKTCVRSLCGERAVRELMTVIVLCETNERTGARRRTGSRRLPPVFRRSTSFPSEGPFVLALPERS